MVLYNYINNNFGYYKDINDNFDWLIIYDFNKSMNNNEFI